MIGQFETPDRSSLRDIAAGEDLPCCGRVVYVGRLSGRVPRLRAIQT